MSLTLLDIIAIIAYLALCVVIGLKVGGRPGDTDSYFTSRGSVPWWAVSFSIVATETSMLTVISVPAVAYLGSLAFFQIVIGYVIGRMIVAWLMLPAYFTGQQQTAYSFFSGTIRGWISQSHLGHLSDYPTSGRWCAIVCPLPFPSRWLPASTIQHQFSSLLP